MAVRESGAVATETGRTAPARASARGAAMIQRGSGTFWTRLRRVVVRPEFILVVLAAFVELGVLLWDQHLAYLSYQASSGELGLYNQSFYTTLVDHRFFYSTVTLASGTGGNMFAIHFMPIYLLVFPFYSLAPAPFTLVVIKQSAIVFAVVPLYLLARLRLKSEGWAALVALCYLVVPITMTLNWTDFDPEAFYPITFFTFFYFLAKGRLWPLVGAWVLALSAEETGAEILLLFVIACLIGNLVHRPFSSLVSIARERRNLLVLIGVGIAWLALAYVVLTVLNHNGGTFGATYAARFSVLGAQSIPSIPSAVVHHPSNAWAALHFDGQDKALYVFLIFACVGFLPVIGGLRYLVPLTAWLSLSLLSNSPLFYSFGAEYPGYVIPFLFAGVVGAIATVARWSESWRFRQEVRSRAMTTRARNLVILVKERSVGRSPDEVSLRLVRNLRDALASGNAVDLREAVLELEEQLGVGHGGPRSALPRGEGAHGGMTTARRLLERTRGRLKRGPDPLAGMSAVIGGVQFAVALILVVSAIATALVAGPFVNDPIGTSESFGFGSTAVSAHDRALADVIAMIPPTASVFTTSHLFPQVSSRVDAYNFPQVSYFAGNTSFQSVIDRYVDESTYVLIDYQVDSFGAYAMAYFANLSGFGLLAADQGAYLYERGWSAPPQLWVPYSATFAPSAMSSDVAAIDPALSTPSGPSRAWVRASGTNDLVTVWTGPFSMLVPPGNYTVSLWLKGTAKQAGSVILSTKVLRSPVSITAVASGQTSKGQRFQVQIHAASGTPGFLTEYNLSLGKASTSIEENLSIPFNWMEDGRLNIASTATGLATSMILFEVTLTQTAPPPD